MLLKFLAFASGLLFILFIAIGCNRATPSAAPTPAQTIAYVLATEEPTRVLAYPPSTPSLIKFDTLSNSDGNVTVEAQLLDFQPGQPLVFEIALNTHSVDLSDDMVKISLLRDDRGKEYAPLAWEGTAPGGHHRQGKLKFAALTTAPKYIELVIKNLAKVSERVFRWDLE